MHWFWRAVIAAAFGTIVAFFGGMVLLDAFRAYEALFFLSLIPMMFFSHLVSAALADGISGRKVTRVDKTHCRKCGYILRGIAEPRCPECGERI